MPMPRRVKLDPLTDSLRRLAPKTDLDPRDIARIMGTTPRTATRWLSSQAKPRAGSVRRLTDVVAVLDRLSTVMKPAAARIWLFAPNEQLDRSTPAEAIRNGRFELVLEIIDGLMTVASAP